MDLQWSTLLSLFVCLTKDRKLRMKADSEEKWIIEAYILEKFGKIWIQNSFLTEEITIW